jgi:hypothetical protein
MKAIDKQAQRTFRKLVEGLDHVGDAKRIDEGGPGIMAVSVERVDASLYSIAHYYVQNGDMMRDPEMLFLEDGDALFPVYYRQDNLGVEQVSVEWRMAGGRAQVISIARALQADHATFANGWLRNIRTQQKLDA